MTIWMIVTATTCVFALTPPNGLVKSSDFHVIRFEGAYPDFHSIEASYWEVQQLQKTYDVIWKKTEEQNCLIVFFANPKVRNVATWILYRKQSTIIHLNEMLFFL